MTQHTVEFEECSADRPAKISKIEHPIPIDGDEEEGMSQKQRIQRYLLAIEYIGTRFSGSQKQLTCRTVVGVLEEAFCKFLSQPVSVTCSSRTDAGVHALSNVCHVDIQRISKRRPGELLTPHEPSVVRKAVNHFLQTFMPDIKHKSAHTSIACCLGQSLCQPLRKNEHGMYLRTLIFQLCRKHAGFLLGAMILVPSGQLVVRQNHQLEL